jgi:two-component system, OmpR family, sensor histidine kinase VicK
MSPLLTVYIVTAVIAITVAFVIAYRTGLSAIARMESDKKTPVKPPGQDSLDDALSKEIMQELSVLGAGGSRAQEASRKVAQIFGAEIEKRISQTSQELTKKYETIIKDKSQNEDVAWRKYKKVLSEKKETDAVIRSIAEGLVVVDAQGKVIMMNPAAEKLLNVSKKEKIGKPIEENLREEELLSMVRSSPGNIEDKEIELVSQQDETKKVLRASSAVIENENGQAIGMVSVLSDITKQKELDEMKTNLVSNVSHELRTPLVAIDKSISLILSKATGPISPDQEKFLSIAERNLKRLSLLIDDLLDLSKLEAGKMTLRRQQSSIEKVVNESVDGLATWAKTKSISIERKIQNALPDIFIDPNRIIQVLNNLIGNAIKFTPAGGTITLAAVMNNDARQIEVSVTDTGMGIEKQAIPKVFDKFFQIGERAPTDISGTGIGLSIAKEFVELHGGRIWVESEKDKGTKFSYPSRYQPRSFLRATLQIPWRLKGLCLCR